MKEKKIFLNIHAEETNAPAATLQIREVKDTISKKVNECLKIVISPHSNTLSFL